MPATELQYFLERLGQRAPHEEDDDHWRRQDDADAVLEVAKYIRDALKVPELERELVKRSQIDATTLKEVRDWLEEVGRTTPDAFSLTFPDGASFEWQTRIAKIDELLASMPKPEELEEIEVGLRLNMVGDPAYERLLMALMPDHPVRDKIETKLAAKLALLTDDDAFAYWSRLRGEVDSSRESHLQQDHVIAPNTFFDVGTPEDVRGRIARYLGRVRPLLIRHTMSKGQTRVPAGNAGIASILSWTHTPSTKAWSTLDRVIIRSLGRIALLFDGDRQELATALGVPAGGYFVGGRAEDEAKRAFDPRGNKTPPPHRLATELLKLARIADLRMRTRHAPLEQALRAYKLGLEVMAPEIATTMAGRREELVQRELCRFLVERGIVAYGTKFGWSETDVRGEDDLGTALIETKRLKRLPSAANLNQWLTQLGSYMAQEQSPKALRGVLVLFNFSPASIFATPETLRSAYSIIAINLCPHPPSKRKASIEIVPTTSDDRIVDVVSMGSPDLLPARKKARKPRAKRSRR